MDRKHSRKLLAPALLFSIAALVLLLKGFGVFPFPARGHMRRYADIEAVKARLGIQKIPVPTYFPDNLQWPPSVILARKNPYPAVYMEFRDINSNGYALEIEEYARGEKPPGGDKVGLADVKEIISYPLKGKEAVLETGTCGGGGPCSRISWDDGAFSVRVAMKSSPGPLIRISGSMID
ncbi:MAG: hypothetical protein M0Z59_08545 [Nitrospiraceae bacterium]|nr:hypothetical protein [Nitrospiraceae bacterium]